jgi:RNA polymerase sigma-70 factor (ECF subfamily)
VRGDEVTAAALAAQDGDAAAAARFVRATQADVWRFCANLAEPAEAEDLTQETYLRAFRALPRFAGRSTARTWLLAIARRVCADHVRDRRRRPRTHPVALLAGTEGGETEAGRGPVHRPAVPDIGDGVALRALLATVEPGRREAFVLTQVVGLSYAEAAEVCGCPVGTIRSRVARARDHLVAELEARPDAGSA